MVVAVGWTVSVAGLEVNAVPAILMAVAFVAWHASTTAPPDVSSPAKSVKDVMVGADPAIWSLSLRL